MRNWKIIKNPEHPRRSEVSPRKCNRFRCMAIIIGIVAALYAGIFSGAFSSLGEKLCSSPAMQPIVKNEYFILVRRLIELMVVRAQVLLVEALVISKMILSRICCGISAVVGKIPGVSKIKDSFRNCQYCRSACGVLLKIEAQAKSLLCSLHSKIKSLRQNE